MSRVVLAGCRTEPLGSYLQGLGAWRAVVRLSGPHTRAHWEGGRMVLTGPRDAAGVVRLLLDSFTPLPVVSPWNAGSGFAGNGRNVAAERALAAVRACTDPRLARLRATVTAGDGVVAEGRRRGWGGGKDDLWKDAHKPDVIALCRNVLPDDALAWVDAAVVLGQDEDPTYSRLLGTGGNFGRQDLSTTYVQRALTVLVDRKQATRSADWLRAALFGDETVPYLREAVGQLDPGRAGGVQSSPWEKQDDKGFANPWSFLLALEGAVMFASAVVRRQGALMSRAAVPFMVRATTVGFGSGAAEEKVLGEIWTPEWDRPARLAEVEHLLGEGRADWNGHSARTGLDFVRAVAALGVDRGVTSFTRHVFAERLGQNPLAVPVGRVSVEPRGSVGLLAALDPWLDGLRRGPLPAGVVARLRQVETALFDLAGGAPAELRDVVVGLGRLHEAMSRSGGVRERVLPLTLRRGAQWWDELRRTTPADGTAELRVAAALASSADPLLPGQAARPLVAALRTLLSPVEAVGRGVRWLDRPPPVPWADDVVAALAEAHRRRALPGAVHDPVGDAEDPDTVRPAVRGVLSAFASGWEVPVGDVVDLATGRLDAVVVGDLLRGLLLLDWSGTARHADGGAREPALLPPSLALLLPFFAVRPLRVRLAEDSGAPDRLVLRPGADWIPLLRAGRVAQVLRDAVRRLRAAGVARTVTERAGAPLSGDRLAAALLLRVPPAARVGALARVAVLPPPTPAVAGDEGDAA